MADSLPAEPQGKPYIGFALCLKAFIWHLLCTSYVHCEQSDVVAAGWWQGGAIGWWPCCQLSLSKSKSPRAQVQHAPQPWLFSERKALFQLTVPHLYSFEPMAYLSVYISFRHQTHFHRLPWMGFSLESWCGGGGSLVPKFCPTLCDPMDCSPPGSSVHGILHGRKLESVAISFSKGSSWPSDQTCVSYLARRFFTAELLGKPWILMTGV